jgi:serine phosphatase RsbU (regulator of sigma subunit)/CHASE2 domain-containing sensor protein
LRLAAVLALGLFLALQLTIGQRLFAPLRLALFDAYAWQLPRERSAAPVVIVAVDDASLRAVGQWPWPRQLVARLIDEILKGRPLALGIDILWPEPDRSSPQRWMQQEGALPPALSEQLLALEDHDEILAAAIGRGPVAIGVAGQRDGSPDAPGPLPPVRILGGDPALDLAELLPSFGGALRSLPELDRGAPGHGLLSADRDADGVIRRMPLVSSVGGRLAPSLGLEMLRLAAGAPWVELRLEAGHVRGVAAGPLAIPTQADATVWVDFSPHDPQRFVSAESVLAGRTPAGFFEQRLVLLGVTGLGLVDEQITPLGPMPGSEIHAQWLENALAGRLAVRPEWTAWAEPGLTAGFALLLIVWLPAVRLRWHFPIAGLLLVSLAGLGFAAWDRERWLIDVATPAVGAALVFVALLGGALAEYDAQRRRLRRELEAERLEAATLEGELTAAARIQRGILPTPASLPPDPRFELHASLTPARHVGGDLYDFFSIDPDHLFLAIGDVSGKGVPASLFMALGKALCKSSALRGDGEIGEIVRRLDREISRDNPEMMFLTLFAGILNLATGELRFCNAGHDGPFLARPGAPPRQLASQGGPPLCSVEGFPYPTESHAMQPGETLCLVTDGVTEAASRAGELMGPARILAAMQTLPPGAGAAATVERLRQAVDQFLAGAPPSDDLALLAVRWNGPASEARSEPKASEVH